MNDPNLSCMAGFGTLSDETIRQGNCTDICFVRTEEILKQGAVTP
jgi:hypothetical protein